MSRRPLDYYILDAISFDAEQLDAIVSYLSGPDSQWMDRFERAPQRLEVQAALMRMVKDGSIHVMLPPESATDDMIECGVGVWPAVPIAEMYFDLTGRGRVLYLNWED